MNTNKKIITAKCSILIYSDDISSEEISRLVGIIPTRTVSKGQLLSKALNTYAPKNGWFYDILCENLEEINIPLQKIAKLCIDCVNKLRNFENTDIRIRCFINTELAQTGFGISPETLSLLASVNKEFEITLFSWGGVEID